MVNINSSTLNLNTALIGCKVWLYNSHTLYCTAVQCLRGLLVGSGGGGTKSAAVKLYTKVKKLSAGEFVQSIVSAFGLPVR